MESNFWKLIKSRFIGPIRRWKNLKRNPDDYLRRLSLSASESDLVIDAGANVGLVTKVLLSQDNPAIKRLWSFEPDPDAFLQLHSINDLRLSKFNVALWDSDGTSTLFRHKSWLENHSHTSSSLLKSKSNVNAMNSVTVTKVDFARVINDSSFNKVTIKMDIEGAEYRVINHLIKSGSMIKIDKIYCEFHPNSLRFGYTMHLLLWAKLLLTRNSHKVKGWV
jgi:FkbM family methyltransferase